MSARILLVEDDPNLGMILRESLAHKGKYQVTLCRDGEEGLQAFTAQSFDLCIIDVMMPRKDGFSLGRDIRRINAEVPIIFATAKSMLEDKVEGFSLGGDDYITKPFNIEELVLRINALLKRAKAGDVREKEEQKVFKIGSYTFDYNLQTLTREGKQQRITSKEAELLRLLCLNMNNILKREEALLRIWNDDSYFNGRSMDVFLTKLRKFLKEDPRVEILNIHGKGYKLIVSGTAV
jgi:DNA-binding response OmpR family regulator